MRIPGCIILGNDINHSPFGSNLEILVLGTNIIKLELNAFYHLDPEIWVKIFLNTVVCYPSVIPALAGIHASLNWTTAPAYTGKGYARE